MATAIEGSGARGAPGPDQSDGSDWRQHRKAGLLIGLAAVVVVGFVVIVNVTHSSTPASSASAASSMTGMPASSSSGGSSATSTTSSMGMSTPSASATSSVAASAATTNGVAMIVGAPPATATMPNTMSMTPIGQANWEGMLIKPVATAPLPFVIVNTNPNTGNLTQQLVSPTKKTSFHLMVALNDASTGYAIPYSSVWATISKGSSPSGSIVLDERLWPMVSRYMGPHYGDDVTLPRAGTYRLTLLVSPPAAARHIEYKGLWLKPHRVSFVFHWQPKT
jgi:uncharacterized protein involved in high-affinity Fe2+ transport